MGYILTQNLVEWRRLLIENNIDGVIDLGSGIIHPSESMQAVFLNPRHLKLVEIFDNIPHPSILRTFRENNYPKNLKEFQYYSIYLYPFSEMNFIKYVTKNKKLLIKFYNVINNRLTIDYLINIYKLKQLKKFIYYPTKKIKKKL